MRREFKRLFGLRTLVKSRRRGVSQERRTLRIEQLDERRLLATDTASTAVLVGSEAVETQSDGIVFDSAAADQVAKTDDLSAVLAPGRSDSAPLWGEGGSASANGYGYGGYGQNPPEIINFIGVKVGGTWIFTGTVLDDEEVAGLTVNFGGLLAGHSATVQVDGTFIFAHVFPPNTVGVVTAVVTDLDGLQSEQEQCGVW
jgi:hypothetical protein